MISNFLYILQIVSDTLSLNTFFIVTILCFAPLSSELLSLWRIGSLEQAAWSREKA